MSCFSYLFSQTREFDTISAAMDAERFPLGALGFPATAKALFIHTVLSKKRRKTAVITRSESDAYQLAEDLRGFGEEAVIFPERDFNFRTDRAASTEYEKRRIGALVNILTGKSDIIIMSCEAALQRTLPPEKLAGSLFELKKGGTAEVADLRAALVRAGYVEASQVEGPGQFSVRGGIVDVYPAQTDAPVRADFWDNEIDNLSFFDVLTQRSTGTTDSVFITPVTEVSADDPAALADRIDATLKALRGKKNEDMVRNYTSDAAMLRDGIPLLSLDRYLPLIFKETCSAVDYARDGYLFVCESSSVANVAAKRNRDFAEEMKGYLSEGLVCRTANKYLLDRDELFARYADMRTFYADNFPRGSFDTPVKELVNFDANQLSSWDGSYKNLTEDLSHYVGMSFTVAVMCGGAKAAEAINEQLEENGYRTIFHERNDDLMPHGTLNVFPGAVTHGLEMPSLRLLIISYGRFARSEKIRERKHHKTANGYNSVEELQRGDYVVHETYGIGRFDGIRQVEIDGVKKDYIVIQYAKSETLQVPVTKLELISKYMRPSSNGEEKPVRLSSLTSGQWEKTKQRVRESVKDVAVQLVKLYAQRLDSPGFAFSEDIDMQNDFERRFEFDETDDQLRAISEIKQDMERAHPMDRLLCGDVGFGKTEVALRAAFKCIADGKQVAFLVPTTILALQHYRTILRRFEGFPIEADMLCRLRTPKQQKETIKKLADGRVDIVTGTHRILSKDVVFKDLGLLIVDEEQRFGVIQKDKIKTMFPGVDILTLSATPIPRTLNQSLSGIKDLSTLDEAPMDRSPVQTYVTEYNFATAADAIGRELRRGGQVYYLKNNISKLDEIAARIKGVFPEAKVGTGHGQMDEEELSDVWQAMTEHELDVLVCTTIIETGVDVPNVNTIIIEDADRMGLAQLHQLRGRVGRSSRKGYAFLMYSPDRELSITAEKRLATIREFTQFGSGLKIAMRDMEIRGVGELLGARQHGMLEFVGYDMYMEILGEEIEKLRNEGNPDYRAAVRCQIDLKVNAYIPDSYIKEYSQKIAMYKRIADIRTTDDSMDVIDELIDRYGEPPEPVMGLIDVAVIKNALAARGVHEVRQNGSTIYLLTKTPSKALYRSLSSQLPGQVVIGTNPTNYYAIVLKKNQDQIKTLRAMTDALIKTAPEQTED